MKLDELPTELLVQICQYFDIGSLSLVNRRLRAISLRVTLRELEIHYPSPRFETLSALLSHSGNAQHVRRITGTIDAPDNAGPFVRLLQSCTGLTDLQCREPTAETLLELGVFEQFPQLKIHIHELAFWQIADQSNAVHRLFFLPNLVELTCSASTFGLPLLDVLLDDDGNPPEEDVVDDDMFTGPPAEEFDRGMLAAQAENLYLLEVIQLLTNAAPALRRLTLWQDSYGRYEDILEHPQPRRNILQRLDLSMVDNLQPLLMNKLRNVISFEQLQELALPRLSEYGYQWLDRNPIVLPQLHTLQLSIPPLSHPDHGRDNHARIEKFLASVPPLKSLRLVGQYNSIMKKCLKHHYTLQELRLAELHDHHSLWYTDGIDLSLLEDILGLTHLVNLEVEMLRTRKLVKQLHHFNKAQLRQLTLRLYGSSAHILGGSGEILKYLALDTQLVTSIYNICNAERLFITTSCSGPAFPGNYEDVHDVINELCGNYEVRKMDGLVKVQALRPAEPDHPFHNLDSTIVKAFRSVWPSKGGRWQDDWSSTPLVEDEAAVRAEV